VSGFARAEDVSRAREAGFNVHLSKPVVASVLLNAINETVGGAPVLGGGAHPRVRLSAEEDEEV
jgi:hypothetical protein